MNAYWLGLFLAVLAVDAAVLLVDGWLDAAGEETISQHVRARPWLGIPLVAWQVLGAAALALHLWGAHP